MSTITNRVIFIILNQVDGGGVQAEVVEADVGASNGVIHSINRVKCSFQETNQYKRAFFVASIFTQQSFLEQINYSILESKN